MTITTESEQTPQEPVFWLPDGCPEWCDGRTIPHYHKAKDDPEDRSHMGSEASVDLSLEPAPRGYPTDIGMYVYQHATDAEATVRFAVGSSKNTVRLTLAEARSLAAALLAMCEAAS